MTATTRANFERNRGIVNRCQTGQLTPEPMAPNVELSQGRVSQLDREFQRRGEAGLMAKRVPGASPKLAKEQGAQFPNYSPKAPNMMVSQVRFGPERVSEKLSSHLLESPTQFPVWV